MSEKVMQLFASARIQNLEMVKSGLAEVDRGRPFLGFDLKQYLGADKAARDAGREMWSLGDRYMSPWEWSLKR